MIRGSTALLVGAGVALAWATGGLARAAEGVGVLSELLLSPAQRQVADQILRIARERGLDWLAEPVVANAYAESLLSPTALGDGGASVGVHQLHERGLGAGLTVEQRQDVALATAVILDDAVRRGAPHLPGTELTRWLAHEVYRCAACGYQAGSGELERRERIYRQLYGAA